MTDTTRDLTDEQLDQACEEIHAELVNEFTAPRRKKDNEDGTE